MPGALDSFHLVDVGASGGLAAYWAQLGDRLHAVGFDPLVANMQRVQAAETRPHVRFEAAFVGAGDGGTPAGVTGFFTNPYVRSSSVRAQELLRLDYVQQHFNDGAPVVWADRRISLDTYFADAARLDFLKVDTDGSDFEVLRGADALLRRGAFLGIVAECPFHGPVHEHANNFSNIERYLAARGFSLYDFDRHRYSRAALPGLFAYEIPAQTWIGQVVWGDALFFRDLAHPDYERTWGFTITRQHILTQVALFDIFGMPDCAADLLLARPDLTSPAERERLLDLLVASAGFRETYAAHVQRFERDVTAFYPSAYRPLTPAVQAPPPPRRSLLRRAAGRLRRTLRAAGG